ncbi:MAG: phosphopantetheine-binding protein [Candidatus Pacearchaeota archaeon]
MVRPSREFVDKTLERLIAFNDESPTLFDEIERYLQSNPNASVKQLRDNGYGQIVDYTRQSLSIIREYFGIELPKKERKDKNQPGKEKTIELKDAQLPLRYEEPKREEDQTPTPIEATQTEESERVYVPNTPPILQTTSERKQKEKEYLPSPEHIWDPLQEILMRQFNAKKEDITPKTRLINDLGADDLDLVELYFEIEDRFEIAIDEENEYERISTIGGLSKYIEEAPKVKWEKHNIVERRGPNKKRVKTSEEPKNLETLINKVKSSLPDESLDVLSDEEDEEERDEALEEISA